MQHDLTIYQCAQALRDGRNPAEVADMLDGIADRMNDEVQQSAGIDLANPAEVFTLDRALSRIADLETRLTDLTTTHADIARRFDNLHAAMRECAKKEALHPSVRFICDTIALNLAAPTSATTPAVAPPAGYTIRRHGAKFVWCFGPVDGPSLHGPLCESPASAAASAWAHAGGRSDG